MATENLVKAIGVTTIDGETRVRFTGDLVTRSKTWQRSGVDCDFVELPQPMERLAALRYAQTLPQFQAPDRARAILEQIIIKEGYAKRDERRAKRQARKAGQAATVSLSEIRARKNQTVAA